MRKVALRQITDRARDFGPKPLFDHILPLLMSPTLEDQERHLLVKVIDRVLYKLDDLVRPYVHKILVVIMPLLIEEVRLLRSLSSFSIPPPPLPSPPSPPSPPSLLTSPRITLLVWKVVKSSPISPRPRVCPP